MTRGGPGREIARACRYDVRKADCMVNACLVLRPASRPSGRQRAIRCRARRLSLGGAVDLAVDAFFRFKYRAAKAPALWSNAECVWLGRETFLYWALWDAAIDIPWLVAQAAGAPPDPDELRAAVGAELAVYWERQTASLPCMEMPRWLPLP
jgi:hypothetical protein